MPCVSSSTSKWIRMAMAFASWQAFWTRMSSSAELLDAVKVGCQRWVCVPKHQHSYRRFFRHLVHGRSAHGGGPPPAPAALACPERRHPSSSSGRGSSPRKTPKGTGAVGRRCGRAVDAHLLASNLPCRLVVAEGDELGYSKFAGGHWDLPRSRCRSLMGRSSHPQEALASVRPACTSASLRATPNPEESQPAVAPHR